MQLVNQQTLPVSQQQAWDALNDTEVLQRCIPGCDALAAISATEFEMAITAAVGPVKAKFKGRMRLSDLLPPVSYRIGFEAQGGVAGHGKGVASVRLEPTDAGLCALHYETTATVGGKLAQVGQRLIDMAAQKMAKEFFANFTAELARRHPVQAEDVQAEDAQAAERPETAERQGLLARLWR